MRSIIAILLIMVLVIAPASAQVISDGEVICGPSVMETASAGGRVAEVKVQVGDCVSSGDVAATLETTRVYAPCDGAVESVYAGVGKSADAVTSVYGSVLTILPENRYIVYATAEYAYDSVSATHIVPGQTVYMRCTVDGSHRGTGVITQIKEDIFLIESTGGTFYNGETVYVYNEDDYATKHRVGKATVVKATVTGVSGTGDIVKLYVGEGDFVEKGQLLFETLNAPIDTDEAGDVQALTCAYDGFVTQIYAETGVTIERDAPLMAVCPSDGLYIGVPVPETDVSGIREGDTVQVSLELSEEALHLEGTVSAISYLPTTDEGGNVSYDVRIALPQDARIVPGLSATVTFE